MKCQINSSLLLLCLRICSACSPSLPEDVPKHPVSLPFVQKEKSLRLPAKAPSQAQNLRHTFN